VADEIAVSVADGGREVDFGRVNEGRVGAVHDKTAERSQRLSGGNRQILVEKDRDLVRFDLGIGPDVPIVDISGVEQSAASVEEDGPRVDQLRHRARIGKGPKPRV
jgi:hypothetical protein